MITYRGVQFNLDLVLEMVVFLFVAFFFSKKFDNPKWIRCFYTIFGFTVVLIYNIIVPLLIALLGK